MKKMKKQDLEKMLNKKEKLSPTNERILLKIISIETYNLYSTIGSGKKTRYSSDSDIIDGIAYADILKIKYDRGNTSKRGGKLGEWVQFKATNVQKRKIEEFIKKHHTKTELEIYEQKEQKEKEIKRKEFQKRLDELLPKTENKTLEFNSEEISNFIVNGIESENIYLFRKVNSWNFRKMREYITEKYGFFTRI